MERHDKKKFLKLQIISREMLPWVWKVGWYWPSFVQQRKKKKMCRKLYRSTKNKVMLHFLIKTLLISRLIPTWTCVHFLAHSCCVVCLFNCHNFCTIPTRSHLLIDFKATVTIRTIPLGFLGECENEVSVTTTFPFYTVFQKSCKVGAILCEKLMKVGR